MDKDPTSVERRRFTRVLFDAPIMLEIGDQRHETRLLDISLKGALVKKPSDWAAKIGDSVNLTVFLTKTETLIHMQTRISHVEDEHVGFLCDEIDMDSITHLRRLVELNLGDTNLLQRELAALG